MNKTLKISEIFSRTPGPRYITEGDFSGELFRQNHLFPEVEKAINNKYKITVDLDGTAGYGTSFLEEAFGGLVRENNLSAIKLQEILEFKSDEESYLIDDVVVYINEA